MDRKRWCVPQTFDYRGKPEDWPYSRQEHEGQVRDEVHGSAAKWILSEIDQKGVRDVLHSERTQGTPDARRQLGGNGPDR